METIQELSLDEVECSSEDCLDKVLGIPLRFCQTEISIMIENQASS